MAVILSEEIPKGTVNEKYGRYFQSYTQKNWDIKKIALLFSNYKSDP